MQHSIIRKIMSTIGWSLELACTHSFGHISLMANVHEANKYITLVCTFGLKSFRLDILYPKLLHFTLCYISTKFALVSDGTATHASCSSKHAAPRPLVICPMTTPTIGI